MDVEVRNNSNNQELRICDIVQLEEIPFSKRDFYIVLRDDNGFIAKCLRTGGGANGYHKTIEDLEKSLKAYGLIHYSRDEFKLVLERKE